MMCFREIPVAKKLKEKRGRGVLRFFVEKILSHSAEKLHRGTFLCCVSENFR